jgi:hypothetical protein
VTTTLGLTSTLASTANKFANILHSEHQPKVLLKSSRSQENMNASSSQAKQQASSRPSVSLKNSSLLKVKQKVVRTQK